MPIDPVGCVSEPLALLRAMLANCEAWRRWVGSGAENGGASGSTIASVDDGLAHAKLIDIDPPAGGDTYTPAELRAMWPLSIIDEFQVDERLGGEGWVQTREALGMFVPRGKLFLRFQDGIPDADLASPSDAAIRFRNNVGLVLQEVMRAGGGNNADLSIHRIEKFEPFRRSDQIQEATMGNRWKVGYVVWWGI